jgi:hypothetical protein
MELVADVLHRELVDDSALLRVDDREEVRLLDTRAPMQARDVQELLRRGAHSSRGRVVERRGAVVLAAHREPPPSSRFGLAARSEMLSTS